MVTWHVAVPILSDFFVYHVCLDLLPSYDLCGKTKYNDYSYCMDLIVLVKYVYGSRKLWGNLTMAHFCLLSFFFFFFFIQT